jgi:succinylglutamate desuccinylase
MSDECSSVLEAPREYRRIVGKIVGDETGPSVIVMSGIHGNEPAGIKAAERVLQQLEANGAPRLRGRLVVLAGNLRALGENTRFIERDLNRQWTPAKVARIRAGEGDGTIEESEQRELLALLEELIAESPPPLHFLDLHISSADGPPFVTAGDTLRNRRFARKLPLPLILGLEEQVDGALLEYLNNLGVITTGVETGHHELQTSVDRHEAVLWLTLAAAGLLNDHASLDLKRCHRLLREAVRGIPRVVEVRHRHAIKAGDQFAMVPGFSNFTRVPSGAVVASDKQGPILAGEAGLILLPLYQGKGDDGFFLSREVRVFWLRLSTVLRHLRLNRLVHLLPGVRRHPKRREVLVVNTRIARLYPLEFFHLFGFRKLRVSGSKLLVSRRRYDLAPPREVRPG